MLARLHKKAVSNTSLFIKTFPSISDQVKMVRIWSVCVFSDTAVKIYETWNESHEDLTVDIIITGSIINTEKNKSGYKC